MKKPTSKRARTKPSKPKLAKARAKAHRKASPAVKTATRKGAPSWKLSRRLADPVGAITV